jgi:hypothetical protein
MREYAVLCVVGSVACGGGKGDAVTRDTVTIAGPPAVSIASSTPAKTGATAPRTSPSKGSKKTPGGPVSGTNATGTTSVPPAPLAAADSVRGIVSVVGTDRDRRVMIARPGSGRRVAITGPLAPLIGHVAGADVAVVGALSGSSLEATRFLVKTVDGAPALDGTLKAEGSALYIVTADGTRTRIVAPPPPLLGHDGARVWITGDPSRGVTSFGFIDPPG